MGFLDHRERQQDLDSRGDIGVRLDRRSSASKHQTANMQ